jgi:hypothetical protein
MIGFMASSSATAWQDGALMAFTSGLLVEALNAAAVNTICGVAASPFTLAITASGGSAIGSEVQPKVGGGTSISGVRRSVYPIYPGTLFVGSIDTSGSQGATALSVTDVGSVSVAKLQTVNASGALTEHAFWILDRTAGNNLTAVITRLIDPPGAKFGDTPVPGINTGQALVEFSPVYRTDALW